MKLQLRYKMLMLFSMVPFITVCNLKISFILFFLFLKKKKETKKIQGFEIKAKNDGLSLNAKELASYFVWVEVTTGSDSLCVLNGLTHHFLHAFISKAKYRIQLC